MPLPIEDYALIGDTQTAALVGRDGSIDWTCFPRFDSSACFAALLGSPENGRWQLAPAGEVTRVERRYLGESLILETDFVTPEGTVRIIDFMPIRGHHPDIVRIVRGVSGRVHMRMDLVVRFDYGSAVPWVRRIDGRWNATAGPDTLTLDTPVTVRGEGLHSVADFYVSEGDDVPFLLTWHPSHEPAHEPLEVSPLLDHTRTWWRDWVSACSHSGPRHEVVVQSLVTLKGLTYAPTGGIVAAPTTSLPEHLGGVRNWDYRYCWVRDATLTLYALMSSGYTAEATSWRDWLLRAVAGTPDDLQIMYGPAGERRLTETELDWLPGYEGSRPVRIGNAAYRQHQLDIYGELADALHLARTLGTEPSEPAWALEQALLDDLEGRWREPDEGIWEVRGPRQHFTHSKVMAWVAFDRAVRTVEDFGRDGDAIAWKRCRDDIRDEVLEKGFDADRGTFTQAYGSSQLDAALLMIPLVGFLPADDPRMTGTVAAIERELCEEGFVHRYQTDETVDGLPPGEGAFLPCTFWLADNYAMSGRQRDAEVTFDRAAGVANDVHLLSEEYDVGRRRLLGNFPQAFSHVALINAANNIASRGEAARHREGTGEE